MSITMEGVIKKIKSIPKRIYRKIESSIYQLGAYSRTIKILNAWETEEYLKKHVLSFCRFGDGEFAIMNGESIAFQEYDRELAEKLLEILCRQEEGVLVGINYVYLNPVSNVNEYTQKFLHSLAKQRKFLLKNCNKEMLYIDAGFTQMYQNYDDYDFDMHFHNLQQLFLGKDITLICGENVLKNLEYNALDVCNSVDYIFAPSMNAYSQYDEIMEMALKISKNRIICIILGPTAKVLVHDLHKLGYIAWDIGHYLKDYDAYKKKQPKTDQDIENFFRPD